MHESFRHFGEEKIPGIPRSEEAKRAAAVCSAPVLLTRKGAHGALSELSRKPNARFKHANTLNFPFNS